MSPERWNRLQEIFLEAGEKQGAERVELLDRACAGDEDLRRSIERMLAAPEGAGDFLMAAVGRAAGGLMAAAQPVEAGQTVGPYRIVRQLSQGGMGAVYLARRADEQFEKQIAIKLIRAGLDTPELRNRFLSERQILARLEHPNIARLLDGGALENGLPYVAMEYVEGVPVTEYVQANKLTIRQCVRLFLAICEAVEYAHRNLVVHRDIKPANILVNREGSAKLLDFGIARLVSSDGAASAPATRMAERLMTPEFASPEQIRGEAVTTATDIYSLGVLLYILMAGQPPYRTEGLSAVQIERLVCEREPERPSVAALSADSPAGAARRLSREIAGDLDQIVAVAIRKDPRARYGSVGQLMDDLHRYLKGYPVEARKGAWTYAASKFVRRHRGAVAAVAALMLVIVGFAVTMAVLERRIRLERDTAERERRAEQQVSDFLVKLFQSSNTDDSRGHPLTARELLDQGVQSVDRELGKQPDVHARLLDTMGRAYESLGFYLLSEPLFERALEIRRKLDGGHTLAVAETLKDLAETLRLRSKFSEAETAARESLSLRRELLGRDDVAIAESLNTVGLLLWQKGDPAAAEPFIRQALGMRTRLEGPDSIGDAVYMSNLGGVLRARNDLGGSEALYRRVVELRRRKLGEHPRTALAMNGLALVLLSRGKYQESEALLRQTLDLRRKLLGDNHPDVPSTMSDLGAVLTEEAKYGEAEELARKTLEFFLARHGENSREGGISLSLVGSIDLATGRYAEALTFNRRALEARRQVLGEHSSWYAKSLADTAETLMEAGDLTSAETAAQQALEIRRQVLGPRHVDTAASAVLLGRVARRRGNFADAEALFREALATDTAILDHDHPARAVVLAELGALLIERGQASAAEPLVRDALAIRRQRLPAAHWAIPATENLLGACLTAEGRYTEAGPLLEEATEGLENWRQARPREAAAARANLQQWRKVTRAALDTATISPPAIRGLH
jgi:eukaryotic-like serine/threonine-protein kinase